MKSQGVERSILGPGSVFLVSRKVRVCKDERGATERKIGDETLVIEAVGIFPDQR